MLQQFLNKVKENKAQVIRVGGTVVGALVGAIVVSLVMEQESVEEPLLLEPELTDAPEELS